MLKAVKASLVYTGKPEAPLKNVYVVWRGKSIVGLTRRKPKNAEVLSEDKDNVVTPAFIDAHSHIGMERAGEPSEEGEVNERMDAVLPHLNAIYSVYMDDKSFRESIEWGVLYSCVLPGSGNIIGGKGVLIRNYARDVEEAYMKDVGVKAALGFNPRRTTDWKGTRPYTRMGSVGVLRKWLMKAADALKLIEAGKRVPEEFDPELRLLFPVVRGEEVLRVHVHKEDDIAALIMLKRELNLRVVIDHACDVHTREAFEKIKKEGIPLVYGPVDAFAYKTELKHEWWRNVRYLVDVRPFFGLMSDHPVVLQRNLYLQLRFFRRFGMDRPEAISLITYNNAKILGVEDLIGSVEPGKWASLVVWKGEPFSLEAYPTLVVAEGKVVLEEG